jgi:hypothetical protein
LNGIRFSIFYFFGWIAQIESDQRRVGLAPKMCTRYMSLRHTKPTNRNNGHLMDLQEVAARAR